MNQMENLEIGQLLRNALRVRSYTDVLKQSQDKLTYVLFFSILHTRTLSHSVLQSGSE